MLRCPHLQWLELDQTDRQWILTDPGRLQSLAAEFSNPRHQKPSIVFFIGNKLKTTALQAVYPTDVGRRREVHGIANLFIHVNSIDSQNPIIVADCTPDAPCVSLQGPRSICHENRRHTLYGGDLSHEDMVAKIQSNLLFPFSQVVCVFADDLGGNLSCAGYLDRLLRRKILASSTDVQAHPHLVIVSSELVGIDRLVQVECNANFGQVFESFQIVQSEMRDLTFLKTTLDHMINDAINDRSQMHLLFDVTNLAQLFSLAASQESSKSIDLLAPIVSLIPTQHVASHISKFVALCDGLLDGSAITEHIASALLVQCYPPEAHYFAPQAIFAKAIEPILCHLTTQAKPILNLDAETILSCFCSLFERLRPYTNAYSLRRRILFKHKVKTEKMRSTVTCLWCLVRPPERALKCGHHVCEGCLERFYLPTQGTYNFLVDRCLICGLGVSTILKIKAPTTMPALLSIDGGGVRGIAALVMMSRLQAVLDVPWPLWRFFHLVAGTSVGGIIALDMTVNQSSIDESIVRFYHWVEEIFPPFRYSFRNLLISFLRDSKYDSQSLEAVMQQAFGKSQLLLDASAQHYSGTKLAIMATETSKSDLRIFANYNGPGDRPFDTGYKLLRPRLFSEEPMVWEVARVTVAAPPYFRPKDVKGSGRLQDGGLKANNPTEPALWELCSIWPNHSRPSIVLSVGTGYHESPTHGITQQRSFWYEWGLFRIIRSFLFSYSLHGQNSWKALLNRLDREAREDYLRLNLEFGEAEPPLDDTSRLSYIHQNAMSCQLDIHQYKLKIWASAFYYELVETPKLFCGYYTCLGAVYCSFDDSRPLLDAINRAYGEPQLAVDGRVVAEFGGNRDYCEKCGVFQQKVKFEVPHLTTRINLALLLGEEQCHISSFPNTIQWIIDRQTRFGHLRSWNDVFRCFCTKGYGKRPNSWPAQRRSKRYKVA